MLVCNTKRAIPVLWLGSALADSKEKMKVKLADLMGGLELLAVDGGIDRQIAGICYNSGKASENSIFVAIEGLKQDGHKYIPDALSKGAKVFIVSKDTKETDELAERVKAGEITIIKVQDTRAALSSISAAYYGKPSDKMELIGVTGTNGKTTVVSLIKSILETTKDKVGLIGTLGVMVDNAWMDSTHTTPESLELQGLFRTMLDVRTDACVMEVSSHALELERVNDCNFDIGIFTNLTHEHLDFHKTMEHYYEAKRKLFFMTGKCNIINIDDFYGKRLAGDIKGKGPSLITYGITGQADVTAKDIEFHEDGTEFQLRTPNGKIRMEIELPGEYNVSNCLAAAACGYAMGFDLNQIKTGLEKVRNVPGRYEVIPTGRDLNIIIDYAHTPDGFYNLLNTVSRFARGRIVMVFGSDGERDHSKRSVMGEIAAAYCGMCVLTTDHCRSEDPHEIANDIKRGFPVGMDFVEILDREEAIRYAILNSRENDTILITGKGHEHRQIIGDQTLYFNEKEIISQALDDLSRRIYSPIQQNNGMLPLPL
jgi:UDP-N-acetylmuramoyl-L-alanyl-D-glutamate--2,6-diaminopimelate ligase